MKTYNYEKNNVNISILTKNIWIYLHKQGINQ